MSLHLISLTLACWFKHACQKSPEVRNPEQGGSPILGETPGGPDLCWPRKHLANIHTPAFVKIIDSMKAVRPQRDTTGGITLVWREKLQSDCEITVLAICVS